MNKHVVPNDELVKINQLFFSKYGFSHLDFKGGVLRADKVDVK